ncbi:MAG: hypothetical protein V1816_19500 [Pseudomonadota bacterium]
MPGLKKVTHKIWLTLVVFATPLAGLAFFFLVTGINDKIEFASLEIYGNLYQRPLEKLLAHLPLARDAARRERDGRAGAGSLAHESAALDQAFSELELVDRELGRALQFTEEGLAKRGREQSRADRVQAGWRALKADLSSGSPEEIRARFQELIQHVRTMITHGGDVSNLILDPDLDSYYLMDATLLTLPQTQVRLADILDVGEKALTAPEISLADRSRLAVFAALLEESDLHRIRGSLETALNEDPNFNGPSPSLGARVPPALTAYLEATSRLLSFLREAAAGKKQGRVDEFRAVALQAREESFRMWDVAAAELDSLLNIRIACLQKQRLGALGAAAAVLLLAGLAAALIMSSLVRPIRETLAILDDMAEGGRGPDQAVEGSRPGRSGAHGRKVQYLPGQAPVPGAAGGG